MAAPEEGKIGWKTVFRISVAPSLSHTRFPLKHFYYPTLYSFFSHYCQQQFLLVFWRNYRFFTSSSPFASSLPNPGAWSREKVGWGLLATIILTRNERKVSSNSTDIFWLRKDLGKLSPTLTNLNLKLFSVLLLSCENFRPAFVKRVWC